MRLVVKGRLELLPRRCFQKSPCSKKKNRPLPKDDLISSENGRLLELISLFHQHFLAKIRIVEQNRVRTAGSDKIAIMSEHSHNEAERIMPKLGGNAQW